MGREGSCCQNTISSSKQQLQLSGCPDPCSHATTANSHPDGPRSHSSLPLRFCFLSHAPCPLVLNPLHHLHHFVFLHACFWGDSRLETHGSGIAFLFCWDILMRLNIFSVFTSCHSLCSLLFSCSFHFCPHSYSHIVYVQYVSVFPLSLRLSKSLGSLYNLQSSPSVFIH